MQKPNSMQKFYHSKKKINYTLGKILLTNIKRCTYIHRQDNSTVEVWTYQLTKDIHNVYTKTRMYKVYRNERRKKKLKLYFSKKKGERNG